MSLFIAGFLLSVSLCLDIGIVNIAIFRAGINDGFKRALEIGIGSTAGDLIYAVISFAGIRLLLEIQWIRWLLWIGGTIALLYLSGKLIAGSLKNGGSFPDKKIAQSGSVRNNFLYGCILALSSPSSMIWFATIGGGLIASQPLSGITGYIDFLSGFVLAAILWSFIMAGLSFYSGRGLPDRIKLLLSFLSAAIFLVLAVINFMNGYRVLIDPQY